MMSRRVITTKQLKYKLLGFFFVLSVVPIIAMSAYFFYSYNYTQYQQVQQYLGEARDTKKQQVIDYIKSKQTDVLGFVRSDLAYSSTDPKTGFIYAFQQLGDTIAEARKYAQNRFIEGSGAQIRTAILPESKHYADSEQYQKVHNSFHWDYLSSIKRSDFTDLILVDPDANIVYTVNKGHEYGTNLMSGKYRNTELGKTFIELSQIIQHNKSNNQDYTPVLLSPFSFDESRPYLWIASPIIHQGELRGYAMFKLPNTGIEQRLVEGDDTSLLSNSQLHKIGNGDGNLFTYSLYQWAQGEGDGFKQQALNGGIISGGAFARKLAGHINTIPNLFFLKDTPWIKTIKGEGDRVIAYCDITLSDTVSFTLLVDRPTQKSNEQFHSFVISVISVLIVVIILLFIASYILSMYLSSYSKVSTRDGQSAGLLGGSDDKDQEAYEMLSEIKELQQALDLVTSERVSLSEDNEHLRALTVQLSEQLRAYGIENEATIMQPIKHDKLNQNEGVRGNTEAQILADSSALNSLDNTTQSTGNDLIEKRRILVTAMVSAQEYWELNTQKNKFELAEKSKLWRVYNDRGSLQTRTFDKYLRLDTLPKTPRWRNVISTIEFVLKSSPAIQASKQDEGTTQELDMLKISLEQLHRQIEAWYIA